MTTYPGSGILAQFYGPQAEVTYGVAPSLTGGHFYAIKGGETLRGKKITAQGEGLFSGKLQPLASRRVLTAWDCGGSIPLELPTRNLQQWLLPMFGSYGQTASALTQDTTTPIAYTATNASPCVFTATASNYSAGTAVVLSGGSPPTGFTNGVNYFVAASPSPTANTFSLAATAGGSAINSSSTGNGTESTALQAYKSVHYPGPLQGNSFVVQKGIPTEDGTVEPSTIVGCKITDWELSVEKHGIAQLNVTVLARNELLGAGNSDPLNVSVPSLVSYTSPIGGVFHWAQLSMFVGGTASTASNVTSVSGASSAVNLKKISVKYTTPLDTDRYFAGGAGFRGEPVDNGLRTITVAFEAEWTTGNLTSYYNAYAADTPVTFQVQLQGPVIGTGSDHSMFSLLIPEMFIDGEPPSIPGPQVVTQSVTGVGLDDGTNNPIQATYWTLDSA